MKIIFELIFSIAVLMLLASGGAMAKAADEPASLSTQTAHIRIPVQSWKTLRDARVVKQDLDYSCSAASLATLLNEFYGQSLTEETLLKAMDKGDLRASFEDMQRVLPQFGFKAQGFAASYEQLMKLKAPVIVYLKHRKDDHLKRNSFKLLYEKPISTNSSSNGTAWFSGSTMSRIKSNVSGSNGADLRLNWLRTF